MNDMIIGIDPGIHCGFAVLDGENFDVNELRPHEACDYLYSLVNVSPPRNIRVSTERFTIGGKSAKTSQTDALEIIGASRWICRRAGVPFYVVGASDASKIGTRATLTKLGWWRPGKPDHYQRASAQAAYTYMMWYPDEFASRTLS